MFIVRGNYLIFKFIKIKTMKDILLIILIIHILSMVIALIKVQQTIRKTKNEVLNEFGLPSEKHLRDRLNTPKFKYYTLLNPFYIYIIIFKW